MRPLPSRFASFVTPALRRPPAPLYQPQVHAGLLFRRLAIDRRGFMTTLLVTHPACLDHLNPPGHPERPDRLRAIDQVLNEERFQLLLREQAPAATIDLITLCHPPDYVEEIRKEAPTQGLVRIDADTSMSPGTLEAVLRAIGGAAMAADEVMAGKIDNAFCAMRPPGHHAERVRAMGFCIFNTAAIVARHVQKRHGVERVAIVDFDVHHGNGTQEIFWSDPTVMYCSTHEMPLYPGTGAVSERGAHNTIVNAPLRAGDGGERFREAYEETILPRAAAFRPEFLVISAGFDAHVRDPLANLRLVEDDFAWATRKLMEIADASANGRIVSVLEGGYDLQGLSRSAGAHVMALMHG
jgi:acetoin utilization deacetylase AcuC-like enzyme